MRNLAITFVSVLAWAMFQIAHAQKLTELDRRNGFKDIQMNSPVDSVRGVKLKKDISQKGKPMLQLYQVDHPDYERIGEIKVEQIQILAYKGLIYEISVITEKDPKLMKGLSSALGEPEFDVRNQTYNWAGNNLSLTFQSHSRKSLQLRYHSHLVAESMKKDAARKIDDIADDF